MDTSDMRVPLQGAVKIFEAGLKSKTWDIHRMPQFITMTHREGCETCDMYASHVIKASEALMVEIPSREVEKAFRIAWLNTVRHIEDEASSESDKKVKWYSDRHNNLTDDEHGCRSQHVCFTCHKSLRGIDGRNTIKGGRKGLPNSMAEHSSPYRG